MAALLLAAATSMAFVSVGQGADLAGAYLTSPAPVPFDGVACADGAPPQWSRVWLGHFQGGLSRYDRTYGQTALTWIDQKMCFPSQRACGAWVRALRHELHRPIGYFTCLPLR
jgi:hypothetical protein